MRGERGERRHARSGRGYASGSLDEMFWFEVYELAAFDHAQQQGLRGFVHQASSRPARSSVEVEHTLQPSEQGRAGIDVHLPRPASGSVASLDAPQLGRQRRVRLRRSVIGQSPAVQRLARAAGPEQKLRLKTVNFVLVRENASEENQDGGRDADGHADVPVPTVDWRDVSKFRHLPQLQAHDPLIAQAVAQEGGVLALHRRRGEGHRHQHVSQRLQHLMSFKLDAACDVDEQAEGDAKNNRRSRLDFSPAAPSTLAAVLHRRVRGEKQPSHNEDEAEASLG